MLFADLFFLYAFLPLCLIFYFVTKKPMFRNAVLIVFSLVFYAWGEPLWIFLLIGNVTVNYFFGLLIEKYKDTKYKKLPVVFSIVVSLGLLAVFKYSGFIVTNMNAILPFQLPVPDIKLPIGISFYTFQIISYIMDCYWGKVSVQHSYPKFLMYVSLFPQLVAGPIVRYQTVEKEINDRTTTVSDVSYGITRIILGLSKKVIIANNLYAIVKTFFEGSIETMSVLGTWYVVILYALYVYFDFSGYSDMAIGLGRIFGFHFDENFRYPFVCKTITEFWQRWHISLGSFFKDYLLYVPIFGKRRQYVSLFLVWFCTGLWHGASWNYVIWGLYFGLFIFLERKIGNKKLKKVPLPLLHIYNKIVIVVGFGIFYFTDLNRLLDFFKNLVGLNGNDFFDQLTATSFVNNLLLIVAAVAFALPLVPKITEYAKRCGEKAERILAAINVPINIVLLLASSILLVNATNNPFLYFNF